MGFFENKERGLRGYVGDKDENKGVGLGKTTVSRILEVLFQIWGWVILSLEVRLTLGLIIER